MSRKTKKEAKTLQRKVGGETARREPKRTQTLLRCAPAFWALFLSAATIFAYQPAWHAGFIWDDDIYVTGNKLLTAPDGLRRIWFSLESPSQYFPLVYTTFRIEYALWGLHPEGYHWVNILLHVANALLLWQLLRLLRVPGAWLAAAIFALHPVHVESVAWITERKNVLMGFFFLLALLCWTVFVDTFSKARWRWYTLALMCYALALSSKTTACTMPAALLLILWLKHEPITRYRLGQIAPFIALGIGMGLMTIWWERYHQGTQGTLFAIELPERFLIASRALWFYASKLVWPAHLSFSYPHWPISTTHRADYVWLAATVALGMVIFVVRRYLGRNVEVAVLFFVTTLIPVLGFIMLYTFRYSFVADHYQYLASIGPLALVTAGTVLAFDFLRGRQLFLKPILCGAVLLLLGFRTWQQCGAYRDMETLWRSTVAANPGSWMAHNNLGILLAQSGRVDEALIQYNKALELNPGFAEAHYDLGNALVRAGRPSEAIERYNKALELEPRMAAAHSNLAVLSLRGGQLTDAIAHFSKALEIDGTNAAIHTQLGDALRRAGRVDEGMEHLRKALELDPGSADAENNLGKALGQMGRMEEAVGHYHKALEINPNNAAAHNNLGKTLRQMGREDEALLHFRKAAELNRPPR